MEQKLFRVEQDDREVPGSRADEGGCSVADWPQEPPREFQERREFQEQREPQEQRPLLTPPRMPSDAEARTG